jgi:hypothetical protein
VSRPSNTTSGPRRSATDQLLDLTLLGHQVESVELRHHDMYS